MQMMLLYLACHALGHNRLLPGLLLLLLLCHVAPSLLCLVSPLQATVPAAPPWQVGERGGCWAAAG